MLEDNMIYQKILFDIDYRLHNLSLIYFPGQTEGKI
jgi:hypothetical protein